MSCPRTRAPTNILNYIQFAKSKSQKMVTQTADTHTLWLGGRATKVARATECVSKSEILPIAEEVTFQIIAFRNAPRQRANQ